MSTEKTPLLSAGNPITLPQAVEWTTNWRNWSLENGFTPETTLKAFYIPIGDIEAIARTAGAAGTRAYLALTDPNDPTSIKIILVPTSNSELVGYGQDMIEPIAPIGAKVSDDPDPLVTIYDMTLPCPRYCDPSSPLFGDPIPPTTQQ